MHDTAMRTRDRVRPVGRIAYVDGRYVRHDLASVHIEDRGLQFADSIYEVFGVFGARRRAKRPSMAYCGDDDGAKEVAATLISDVGFEPVDTGPLRIARYLEPFALLMGQLAYEGDGAPEIAYRFERFEKQIAQEREKR